MGTRWLCNDCCRAASPLFLGGRRGGGKSASGPKPRDNPPRRRLTRRSTAFVGSSVALMMGRGRCESVFDRQLGRARIRCPKAARGASQDRMLRKRYGQVAHSNGRAVCHVSSIPGERLCRLIKAHSSRIEPRVEGAFSMHSLSSAEEPESRISGSFVLMVFSLHSHRILASASFKILSWGTSRNGTRVLSMPSRAPRATRLTPPCPMATVFWSRVPSHFETRTSRSW